MDPTGGILSYVVKKLGDTILSEAALLGNTQRDLKWVNKELGAMLAFLEDAANVQLKEARLNRWIEDIRELAFHAEDVIDTFSIDVGKARQISFLSCLPRQIKPRHYLGTGITELRETVAELSRRKVTYDIKIPEKGNGSAEHQSGALLEKRRLTAAPYVEDRDVVGLDRHVMAVKGLLVPEESRRLVVSIVGMGGLGKTTLAKKVYNNLLPSFDCTAWVDVSQKYSNEYLLRRISTEIFKLSQKDEQEMNQAFMMSKLCGTLRSKKSLIVLDDVWTSELWDTLNRLLPDAENGSRVIITTRKEEVARLASTETETYRLSTLDDVESKALFTNLVFPNEENAEQCFTKKLASLRQKIVKKCGGLPLAITVVGGLLSTTKKSPAEWKKVAEKIDWHQTEKGEQCMGILALSYVDLPIHLKWCFLYLGALPEDCVAYAKFVMLLWIAEGFIKEEDGVSMEERAETYLEELARRCLIQAVEEDSYRKDARRFRVHGMIHELAVREAKKIRFLDVWRSAHERSPGTLMRRLSYIAHGERGITTHLPLGSNQLRTLLVMGRSEGNFKWSSTLRNLKLVRVLQISVCLDELTEEIGDMVNLRYLALSGDKIRELPESLGKLRHLQTLNVRGTKVGWFPASIWKIKTLRYLLGGCDFEDPSVISRLPMPKTSLGTNVFENMRTLRGVHVDPWMETILPSLIHLKELQVQNVDQGSMSKYLSSTLKKLQGLEVLILESMDEDRASFSIDEIFSQTDSHTYLRSLELRNQLTVSSQRGRLPQNLTRVSLWGTKSKHDVLELLGSLKYLRHLILGSGSFTEDDEMVFKSGWFPQLHVLDLCNLGIKKWALERRSLPLLRELRIENCTNLEELPEGLQHINTLKEFWFMGRGSSLGEKLRKREGADWVNVKNIERVCIKVAVETANADVINAEEVQVPPATSSQEPSRVSPFCCIKKKKHLPRRCIKNPNMMSRIFRDGRLVMLFPFVCSQAF